MSVSGQNRAALLEGIRVLDGGMASELEYLGARIDGPLWSAYVLEEAPEKIVAVHRAYIAAGADCIETASYQVSRWGYAEIGLELDRADAALLRSVALAREAAAAFPDRRVVIAASLGPYGAVLHNGAEYHGNYDLSHAQLVEFHRERIDVLARAIGEALAPWPDLAAWFSFTCKDAEHVAHGERLSECAAVVAEFPQTVAIGVNCALPALIPSLIRELRGASEKPVVVYPNSGEGWDAVHRSWTGTSDPAAYGAKAREWFAAGARMVGGCCRTRPEHIRQVRDAGR
ncbi:MAG TPA: homocysteine S-methyltransferase [Terracidiphilus sp.]|nr:homocysteine S-methyltransferase [Terracidiphilus sp.]